MLCRDLKTDVREANPGHLTVIIAFVSLRIEEGDHAFKFGASSFLHRDFCFDLPAVLSQFGDDVIGVLGGNVNELKAMVLVAIEPC